MCDQWILGFAFCFQRVAVSVEVRASTRRRVLVLRLRCVRYLLACFLCAVACRVHCSSTPLSSPDILRLTDDSVQSLEEEEW